MLSTTSFGVHFKFMISGGYDQEEKFLGPEKQQVLEMKNIERSLNRNLLTPWQFLRSISHTVGCMSTIHHSHVSDSEDDSGEQNTKPPEHLCVVCLSPRTTTWIFMPCRHASFCDVCSQRVIELESRCDVLYAGLI